MESSLSVCMLHTEGELATLQLPCASSSSAILSRLMSVAIDCTIPLRSSPAKVAASMLMHLDTS